MKLILTSDQKQALETLHDQTRDGRVRDRIKAVLLTWTTAMISQALRIHESTVRNHLADYTLSETLKPKMAAQKAICQRSKRPINYAFNRANLPP